MPCPYTVPVWMLAKVVITRRGNLTPRPLSIAAFAMERGSLRSAPHAFWRTIWRFAPVSVARPVRQARVLMMRRGGFVQSDGRPFSPFKRRNSLLVHFLPQTRKNKWSGNGEEMADKWRRNGESHHLASRLARCGGRFFQTECPRGGVVKLRGRPMAEKGWR